jgi:hypothetical protein
VLPYEWLEDNGRLCCRLRPLPEDQLRWVETERVADFPDIELRILAAPRSEPQLAEIVFPPAMSIAQAKEYIYRELQELPVRALGHSACWIEESDRLVLRLAEHPAEHTQPVALEEGVREMLAAHRHAPSALANGASGTSPPVWETCCIEFDRSAGWEQPQAQQWVEKHLGLCDLGRTIRLAVLHRMQPDLGLVVRELLYPHEACLPSTASTRPATAAATPAVELVCVPAVREPSRGLPRKGGAGLEADLGDVRQRDRVPPELRSGLPQRGLVNYPEAQAVVRALEALAGPKRERGTIGVVALFAAQADLIRKLIEQSATLRGGNGTIVVDTPDGFRQRDDEVVLVSLTRSHSHRAVSYGDGPHDLALAFTRARTRLILFGDAGTLARRSQWEGPLDHLDESASKRERELASQLVRYLEGQGAHANVFQVRESSPS